MNTPMITFKKALYNTGTILATIIIATIIIATIIYGFQAQAQKKVTMPPITVVINGVIITDIDTSRQETQNIVMYHISVPGKPGIALAATLCTLVDGKLTTYTSQIMFGEQTYALPLSKKVALYICTQKES